MSDSIKPLQSEVKIVDNASQAFDAIRESILGAAKAFDSFLASMHSYQNLKLEPLELKANIQPVVVPTRLPIEPYAVPAAAPVTEPQAAKETSQALEQIQKASESMDRLKDTMATFDNQITTFDSRLDSMFSGGATDRIREAADNVDRFKDSASSFDNLYASLRSNQKESKVTTSLFDKLKESLAKVKGPIVAVGKSTATATASLFDKLKESLAKLKGPIDALGKGSANATMSLKSIGEAFRGLQAIAASARAFGQIFKLSDESARFRARLGNLTEEQRGSAYAGKADGSGYTTEEIDKSFLQTANTMGMQKGDLASQTMTFLTGTGGAFDNIGEAAKFTELLTKQFVASGVSAESAAGAIEQIRQGLSKGALQGEDLKSVLSHAPQIAERFAEKLGVSVGEVGELASQGKLTADIVKGAMFDNADAIEAAFNNMPVTWESVANRLQNTFLDMADPILQKIGELTSTDMFNDLLQGLMSMVDIALTLVDVLFTGFEAVRPVLEPIVSGFAFMAEAVQNNIKLVGILGGTMLGIGVAYKVITSWQKISIALNKLMAATNPFLLIVTVIMAAILALKHLWDTNIDFQFAVKKGWNTTKYMFSVGFSYIKQVFQGVIGAIILYYGVFLGAIQDGLNGLVTAYNFFAKDENKIEAFSFGDTVKDYGKELLDPTKHQEERSKLKAQRNRQNVMLTWEKAKAIAQAEKNANADGPVELAHGQTPTKPLHTKGSTKIDRDSIQLLKDIASVELVNRYTTIRPRVRVNVGTINHEADVDNFFDRFATEVENANASSLSEVYA